jgi:hypothetical protein
MKPLIKQPVKEIESNLEYLLLIEPTGRMEEGSSLYYGTGKEVLEELKDISHWKYVEKELLEDGDDSPFEDYFEDVNGDGFPYCTVYLIKTFFDYVFENSTPNQYLVEAAERYKSNHLK